MGSPVHKVKVLAYQNLEVYKSDLLNVFLFELSNVFANTSLYNVHGSWGPACFIFFDKKNYFALGFNFFSTERER